MRSVEMGAQPEQQEITPEETLQYLEKLGNDIAKYAKEAQAMFEIAKERGVEVNFNENETLNKFKPQGEYESQLVILEGEVLKLKTIIADSGLKIKREELEKKMNQMEAGAEEK
ncbi:MAG TPA: hypothetical protein VI998_00070 [Patescibacteria group bacterium]|nr:hypothetical protein [Patescibacteria group bacterium]